jgi:WD40 repeat protein
MATACANSEVRRWDLPGRAPVTIRGHTGPVAGLAIDPVGGLLATHSRDGTSRMWDAESGTLVLATETGNVIGFSRDGERVEMHVEGHGSGIYALERSTVYRTLAGAPEFRREVRNLDFTPDAERMAVTTSAGLTILEMSNGQALLAAPISRLGSAWFIDDGRALLTTGDAGLQRYRFEEHDSGLRLRAAEAWPAGDRRKPLAGAWATAGPAPRMGVAAGDGALVVDLHHPLEPAFLPCGGNLQSVSVSPDSRYVAITTRQPASDGFVLDRETGDESVLADTVDGIAVFSPCGRWLATTTGRQCTVRDTGTWRVRWKIARLPGAPSAGALAFSNDGNQLAIARSLTLASVVDSATGHDLVSLPAPHPDRITSLAFSPDDRLLAVGTGTGIVQCWNLVRLREELARFGLAW